TIPCISERAREVLGPIIEPYCEILEFASFRSKTYYVINVLTVVDCLDWETSECYYSNSTGRLVDVKEYRFDALRIPNAPIFKVFARGLVFVQQPLVDLVVAQNLTNSVFFDPAEDQFALIVRGADRNIVPGLS
ncbi:MAG: DUF1629 domain-containing protein, partial [Fimbriimonadaceae bacterium]